VSRQLDDLSGRVADNVQVLALDYALRAAIAQRDQSTCCLRCAITAGASAPNACC
jgi:hypothetical protein